MKWFWNDKNGLTVLDVLAIALGLSTPAIYWKHGSVDPNYANIVIAAMMGAAGQVISLGYSKSGANTDVPAQDESKIL